jgi:replicative DNA helicase
MRALIQAGTEITRDGYDGLLDAEQATSQAEQRIFALRDRQTASDPVEIKEVLHRCLDELDRRQRGEQVGRVLETGFSDLDATLAGGLRAGQLAIMAGRPSMGKTACATDIARHAAREGHLVLFISLEMSSQELGDRLLVAHAGVDGHRVRSGTLSQQDKLRMVESAGELASWNLYLEDNASLQVHQISSVARRLARKQKQPLGLLVVDYLQLIEENRGGRDSREQEVSRNSRALKRLSKELDCPVLCVAQLNRKADDVGNHRPKLSHLRESGAIEQDADVVMFVHREEYYLHGEEAREKEGQAEIVVAKNRNGPQADVEVRWDKRSMRFQDLAPERLQEFDDYNDDRSFR